VKARILALRWVLQMGMTAVWWAREDSPCPGWPVGFYMRLSHALNGAYTRSGYECRTA